MDRKAGTSSRGVSGTGTDSSEDSVSDSGTDPAR